MKGDFSRDTFDPAKHFTRVLMQQGRVMLDSDWNEQGSLLLHYLRSLAADLIGPHGGPQNVCGFKIMTAADLNSSCAPETPETEGADDLRGRTLARNFLIGSGRYYVGGLLCENPRVATYATEARLPALAQPDLAAGELADGAYLVYLDAWEHHVTALEDESIREVALGAQGPDTATRARVAWQVRALRTAEFERVECGNIQESNQWKTLLATLQPEHRGLLSAKADEPDDPDSFEPCTLSPDARFRGAENQLYRVEIHRGGRVGDARPPTFKWSRENGSVMLPVSTVAGQQVTLDRLGRDARSGVQVGDWVEVFDEDLTRRDRPTPLLRVTEVNPVDMVVTLDGEPHDAPDAGERAEPMRNPLLRRWDQKEGDPRRGGLELRDGAALVKEGRGDEGWLELEDGIRIKFEPNGNYRAGDYWLIPARTATGDVEWPGEVGRPEPRPPHGVTHFYAPLARIEVGGGGVTVRADYRRRFVPLAACFPKK